MTPKITKDEDQTLRVYNKREDEKCVRNELE
jgi:hypothetical protein